MLNGLIVNFLKMKKYKIFFIFVLFVFCFAKPVFAISGFLPKQIWYSSDKLVEGETVDIYTAVWNGEDKTYLLKIGFFDEEELLGERDIALKPGEIRDVSIGWKITAGDHIISARILSSEIVVSTGKKESVTLRYNETEEDKQRIDALKKKQIKTKEEETNIGSDFITVANSVIPKEISQPVSKGYQGVDLFREKTYSKISTSRDEAKEELETIKKEEVSLKDNPNKKQNKEDAFKKPFVYIKLLVLGILSLIFSNKIIFYPLVIFLIFIVLRFSYRKIKGS